MQRYKIIQCPKCGKLSTAETTKIFNCVLCGRSTQLFKKDRRLGTTLGLRIIYTSDNAMDCVKKLQALKGENYEK